jgi:hypothetical protein
MRLKIIFLALLAFFWATSAWAAEENSGPPDFLKAATLLTGGLIAGEALALLVGMHFLSPVKPAWATPKNDTLLGLDLLTGAGLIYLGISEPNLAHSNYFYLLSTTTLLSHGYREWEYLGNTQDAFAFNQPLFVVNTMKLTGSLIILSSGAWVGLNLTF